MLKSFGITPAPTTVRNPSANFVERTHQTLGNVIRAMDLENVTMDVKDPWSGILANAAWAIRSTVHTVLDATPGQIIFGRDMLFDLSFRVDWNELRKRRSKRSEYNRANENKKRIAYTYKVGDNVLLNRNLLQRKLLPPRDGPFRVTKIYGNGTLKINKGITSQIVSIRRLHPYLS